MKELLHSLQSEWIKTKNSAIIWLTITGALFVPLIILFARLLRHTSTVMMNSTIGIWLNLFNQNWQFMATFLLPMGVILAASLITQIEFRNNTWKQLYTTPQKLSTIFFAKYLIVLFVLLQFFLLFNIGIYLCGAVPSLIYKDVLYPNENFPFKEFFAGNCSYFIYALPIISLQYLLSLHIKNFVIPIGIGLVLVVASLIGINFQYGYIIPYIYGAMKFLVADNRISPNININYWALGYFLFFTAANYLIFICKTQITSSKYFKLKILIPFLVFVLIGGICLGVFKSSASNKKALSDNSPQQIEECIRRFEQNLGMFHTNDNTYWTLQERMKFYKVNGMSIAVVKNYKIEWAKGYGFADVESKIPVTENTIFEPGSISKSVNALALMKLVQNKKINLFDDINHYLSSWKFPYDNKANRKIITLANLLSHTAGLSVPGFGGYKFGDSLPTIYQTLNGQFPANNLAVRSIFEPSNKMEYSGGGTMISQLLLMDITKQPYDKFLQETVFGPLGMTNSFFTQPIPDAKIQIAATGYDSLGIALKGKYPIMTEQAAAGLWTTPTDLCKVIIEMQLSLQGKSNKILNQQNTEMVLTPYLDESVSLGYMIDDHQGNKYFKHEAGNYGFSGVYYGSVDDGNGVAILINSENSGILKEIGLAICDVYEWAGFPKKESKTIIKIEESVAQKYIGIYEGEGKKVEIKKEDNSYYYLTDKEKRRIYFTTNTEFINMEIPSLKTFNFDKDNVVTGFTVKYHDKQASFRKI